MADKGFTIEDMLSSVGARLIIPPFKCAKQFSKQDCEKIEAIACLRILVARVIRRVKENHICDSVCHSPCQEVLIRCGIITILWLIVRDQCFLSSECILLY